ncbi:hypothetical protein ACWKSP_40140 [Micromonosporaceae bacterium Da 78-11]
MEAVRRGQHEFYRLINGDNVLDDLTFAALQQMLVGAGIDMADLVEADEPATGSGEAAGAA